MKKSLLFASLAALLGAALAFGYAMDEAELSKHMKAVGKSQGMLREGMKTADMAKVAEGAEGIATHLTGTDEFWTAHKLDDAVKHTQDGIAAAKAVAAAAKANDVAAVKTSMQKMGGSCKGCHDAHREKVGENEYKVKL